jgi:hypothetical protein
MVMRLIITIERGIPQPVINASGTALAYTRTPSARRRVTRKITDASRRVLGPNRFSRRTYAVS